MHDLTGNISAKFNLIQCLQCLSARW